ncbi:hypothetical protein BOTCAL_0536g00060 [Botryotinia calthae]|uniref:Uncharacterized protein n=1 Tax=Botryotinia calthae TaxID=38488 RepID=A0A4Y8CM75_9HELO|nr:hypothetical protein BOTCAL_0536g00060 [Botryotinia calthae]
MPRSRKLKRYLNDEVNKLNEIARVKKLPEFLLLLPLVQDPFSTVPSVLEAHSALTLKTIADAKKEIVASKSGFLGIHPYNTWLALLVLVGQTPPTQQSKIVEFILGLQKIELVDKDTDPPEVLKYSDEPHDNEYYWRDMPGFGMEVRGIFNLDLYSPFTTDEQKTAYENQNAFLAQLLAKIKINTVPEEWEMFDYSAHALWVLCEAFENEGGKNKDSVIRSACWWLVFAAEKLWFNVAIWRGRPDGTGVGWDYGENNDWVGYIRERWEFWKECLRNANGDGQTGILIKDALACMERATGPES